MKGLFIIVALVDGRPLTVNPHSQRVNNNNHFDTFRGQETITKRKEQNKTLFLYSQVFLPLLDLEREGEKSESRTLNE